MPPAMRRTAGFSVLAALVLVPSAARAQIFTQADKQAILLAHNQARCAVSPTAQTMPALSWDVALEATAQAWANLCVDLVAPFGLIDHNPTRSSAHLLTYGYVGENIYGSSGFASPTQAVQLWVAEKVDYNFATNVCTPGKVCGHYTQVVWANTVAVGCARVAAFCPGQTYGSAIVCDYGPGGNDGNRPYVSGAGVTQACDRIFIDGFES
jgi:pathogenesis-related protein 1